MDSIDLSTVVAVLAEFGYIVRVDADGVVFIHDRANPTEIFVALGLLCDLLECTRQGLRKGLVDFADELLEQAAEQLGSAIAALDTHAEEAKP